MGPKFDPTAITIGKNILTKKSLVIPPPPQSETYQQAWSGKFCWLGNGVLNTIELCVFTPTYLSLQVHDIEVDVYCKTEDLVQIGDMSPIIHVPGKNWPPFSSLKLCTEIYIERFNPFWTFVKSLVDCLGIFSFSWTSTGR